MTDTIDPTRDSGNSQRQQRLTLRKSFKLRHRTLVQGLFEKGKSVYSGPLRLTFRALGEQELSDSFRGSTPDRIGPLQVMITVPKKKRHFAVDRVLMRRRIREAFRLQCRQLRDAVEQDPSIRTLSIAVVYMQGDNAPMSEISPAMTSSLVKIQKKLWPQPSADENC